MKSLWNSFKIAFAMFSKIPVPQAEWTKENMKYMFCFFPFIGAVIGAVLLGLVETLLLSIMGSGYSTIATFAIMLVFLLLRPRGIAGSNVQEKA